MAPRPPRVRPLTPDEEAFWRAFLKAWIVVPRVLFAELEEAEHLGGSEYSVLAVLSEAKGRRLRMSELASSIALSISGMTRIVDRLAKDGLVQRVRDDEDTRMVIAVLTDAGLRRLKHAYPVHLAGVRRNVIDHLDGFDLGALAKAFERFGDPEGP
ncbi:MAG: MarR family transcriptional regulator [Actinomycetota bacterium]|nr:MarR family transcriptional regulator [Actinomycetota bacterium]